MRDDKLKIKIWKTSCVALVFLTIFLIICVCGLRHRADNLQIQLEQCAEVEEQVLLPCPVCGKEVKINPVNDFFYIECERWDGNNGCGLTTSYYDSKSELIELWNGMVVLSEN